MRFGRMRARLETQRAELAGALDRIRAADGVVFACPEYNFSMTGVTGGTTLHNAAPRSLAAPTNCFTCAAAAPP